MKKVKLFHGSLFMGLCFCALLFSGCSKEEMTTETDSGRGVHLKSGSLTAEVTLSGTTWKAVNSETTVYSGSDMFAAVNAAIASLPTRTTYGTVNIRNSGNSGSSDYSNTNTFKAIRLKPYTTLNFYNNTINANSGDDWIVPIFGDRVGNIKILNLKITGRVRYGIWMRSVSNLTITNITEKISSGLCIRLDPTTVNVTNVTINGTINLSGSSSNQGMGIETSFVDGLVIGDVVATDLAGCGVLLNNTKNVTINSITATRCDQYGSYAGFRCANTNGPNIVCKSLIAKDCGRGFFSCSNSVGTTINKVTISGSYNQGILLENCQGTSILSGTVTNSRSHGVRISQRSSADYPEGIQSKHNKIQGLQVHDNAGGGFYESNGDYNIIQDCDFTSNSGSNFIKVGPNTTVTNCTF
jgi:hypothetical protein